MFGSPVHLEALTVLAMDELRHARGDESRLNPVPDSDSEPAATEPESEPGEDANVRPFAR